MDKLELPDDLGDVEVIYLDGDIEDDDDDEAFDQYAMDDENNASTEDLPVIDLAKLTFDKHKKSVFAGALSRDGSLALTGGEDDTAFLWQTASGAVVFECTGHKDSVTAVGFNHDEQLIATGDMSGMIQVWSIKEQKLLWCSEGDDLEWLLWHPETNVLCKGCKTGEVYIWLVPAGSLKVLPPSGAAASAGRLLADGKRLLVGYGDGQLRLWDIRSAATLWAYQCPRGAPVHAIELSAGGLAAVAPQACLVKAADGKPVGTLLLDEASDEVEALAFSEELGALVTGSLSGQLSVWDIGKRAVRFRARVECAVTVIRMGAHGRFYAGGTDGCVYVCDVRTGTLIERFTGHGDNVLSLSVARMSEHGEIVLSTSDDGTAKIFVKS